MKRREKFPIMVAKNGVTAPVYEVRSGNGYVSYDIAYRENGARKKQGFTTVAEVLRGAKKAAGLIASDKAHVVKLTGKEAHT